MMWYKMNDTTIELRIFAKPNARCSEIVGVTEHGLSVQLKARPQDGEANSELIAFLAKYFHLTKRQITIRRGEASRHKAVILPLNSHVQLFIERMAASVAGE